MRTLFLSVSLVVAATLAGALNLNRLQQQAAQLKAVNQQRQTAPPADQPKLEAQRQQIVTEIRGAAESEPGNFTAQYAVARGFMQSGEEGHATMYADRAVDVAKAAGDKEKELSALTLSALAYQKAGDPEAAADRAKKALWINPKNDVALSVLLATKGRISKGAAGAPGAQGGPAATGSDAPLPEVKAATSGGGRSSFAGAEGGPAKPNVVFVGADTQKAAKLLGEAQRTWKLDRKAALKLFDEAVAADAKSAAVRAARARARLEMKDYQGALEDADASLVGGPSGEASFVKAVALKALGGKEEDILKAYTDAAAADSRYVADYQSYIAALGREGGATGAPATAQAPAMTAEPERGPDLLLLGGAAAAALALLAGFVLMRRRREDE